MSSKLLQTPKIIKIVGSTIYIAHPDTKNYVRNSLAAPIAAAGTAMSVYDNNGFEDNDWFIVGAVGDRNTEDCDVNGAVTRGQSMTVTNTLAFAHELDAPITKIFERGIKIYGAATDGGAGTLIASIDDKTASGKQLADSAMIQWDKQETQYTLISTDTTYNYYFAKFTDGATDSSASTYVPATGVAYNKIEPLIKEAIDITNTKLDNKKITREMLVNWANSCQDAITQFTYQDSTTGRFVQKDWSFEVVTGDLVTLVEGEDRYSLSGLGLKYPNSDKSVFALGMTGERPMRKIAAKDFDIQRRGMKKTYMNGTGAVAATSITVDSTANFDDSGSLTIGDQRLTYTAKTSTTFTGIPASGTGSIGTLIADNTAVWQGQDLGQPTRWLIYNGYLYFDMPPSSSFAGKTITLRYLKTIDRITSVSDGTSVPFTNVFPTYFAAMIFFRLGQTELGQKWMTDFSKQVLSNAQADVIPMLDEWTYYNYGDDVYDEGVENSVSSYYDF